MFIALFATSYKESWVCRRWLVVGRCHPATAADVHSTQRDLVGKKSVTFIILFLSLPLRRKAAICVDEINLQYYMQHWIVKRLFLPSLPSHHFIFFFCITLPHKSQIHLLPILETRQCRFIPLQQGYRGFADFTFSVSTHKITISSPTATRFCLVR